MSVRRRLLAAALAAAAMLLLISMARRALGRTIAFVPTGLDSARATVRWTTAPPAAAPAADGGTAQPTAASAAAGSPPPPPLADPPTTSMQHAWPTIASGGPPIAKSAEVAPSARRAALDSAARSSRPWPAVHFAPQSAGADFAGAPSAAERRQMLGGRCAAAPTKCGFVGASGFDALAADAAGAAARAKCDIVVVTTILGRKDKLQQPTDVPSALRGCYFAVVDLTSAEFLRETAPRSVHVRRSSKRIGAWRLLLLRAPMPYASSMRRNSRVAKMLPFRLFPRATYAVYVDGKLRLRADPREIVHHFLVAPRASVALARNLRRDTIDQEYAWIRAALCGDARKVSSCDDVDAQWAAYSRERAVFNGSASDDDWASRTVCVEGALVIVALQSALARCFLCAWYNEMHARSERDQLSFSYTMAAMGLTPDVHAATSHATPAAPNATAGAMRVPDAGGGIYVWPRNEHWRAPAETGRPKPWRYVQYVGHGGPGDDSTAAPPAAAVLHAPPRSRRTYVTLRR